MQFLKADTAATILIGPFLDKGDGVTPEESVTLAGADSAELMKHDGTTFVDLTTDSRTFTHREKGMYTLVLGTGDTDTEGRLTVFISDESVCLPVWKDFMVVNANVYDSFFAAAATDYLKVKDDEGNTLANESKQDTIDGIVDDILVDTAVIGALGAGLTAIPWNANWDTEVESEVTDSLVAHNLDHLCKTVTAAADMTAEVVDNSILSRILSNGDTSAFVPSTDAIQLIHDDVATVDTVVDAIKANTDNLPSGPAKNVALSGFTFVMRLALDHVSVATGKTITAQVSKDKGAFAACTNSATEIGSGVYYIDLTATEMNAAIVTLKFSETDCDTTLITILTSA